MKVHLPEFTSPASFSSLPLTPPFFFEHLTVRMLPLPSSLPSLQNLLDRYLNFAPPDVGRFRAVMPYTFLMMIDYGKLADQAANLGWLAQHEVMFAVPACWYALREGRWVYQGIVFVTPFIFVDNDRALTLGRWVYGWPKLRQALESPLEGGWMDDPSNEVRKAVLSTPAYARVYSGERQEFRVFCEVVHPPTSSLQFPPDLDTPYWPWSFARNAAELMSGTLRDFMGTYLEQGLLPMGEYASPDAFFAMATDAMGAINPGRPDAVINTLNLKQFRDVEDPDKYCYQALTVAPMRFRNFHRAGPLGDFGQMAIDASGGYRVRLRQWPSLPIVDLLGLRAERTWRGDGVDVFEIKPVRPFWYDVDMVYDRGTNLAWRTHDRVWTTPEPRPRRYKRPNDDHDPAIEALDSAFNTVLPDTSQTIAGPFHHLESTVRVFPLLADPEKLQEILERYLNRALEDGLPSGDDGSRRTSMRFEPWFCGKKAYVYLVITKSVESTSATDNIGQWEGTDACFFIPVKWYRCEAEGESIADDASAGGREAGREHEKTLAGVGLVPTFSYVETTTSVISDTEVLGWPAATAKFVRPSLQWLDNTTPHAHEPWLRVETEVLPSLGQGQQTIFRPIIEVNRGRDKLREDTERLATEWVGILKAELERKYEARGNARKSAEAKAIKRAKAKATELAKALAEAKAKAEAEAEAEAEAKATELAKALAGAGAGAGAEAEAEAKATEPAKALAEALATAETKAKALAEVEAEPERRDSAEARAMELGEALAKVATRAKGLARGTSKELGEALGNVEIKAKELGQVELKGPGPFESFIPLVWDLLHGDRTIDVFTLKQFRDVTQMHRACYQALVRIQRTIEFVHDLQPIDQPLHLRISQYPDHDIVSALGLVASEWSSEEGGQDYLLFPIRPFWMRLKWREDRGQRLCHRTTGGASWSENRQNHWRGFFEAAKGPHDKICHKDANFEGDPIRDIERLCWARSEESLTYRQVEKAMEVFDPQMFLEVAVAREWGNRDEDETMQSARKVLERQCRQKIAGALRPHDERKETADFLRERLDRYDSEQPREIRRRDLNQSTVKDIDRLRCIDALVTLAEEGFDDSKASEVPESNDPMRLGRALYALAHLRKFRPELGDPLFQVLGNDLESDESKTWRIERKLEWDPNASLALPALSPELMLLVDCFKRQSPTLETLKERHVPIVIYLRTWFEEQTRVVLSRIARYEQRPDFGISNDILGRDLRERFPASRSCNRLFHGRIRTPAWQSAVDETQKRSDQNKRWTLKPNLAQYAAGEGTWEHYVETRHFESDNDALEYANAEKNKKITFFFYCRQFIDLDPRGVFYPGDAVFFSGEPWFGSAPQCDAWQCDDRIKKWKKAHPPPAEAGGSSDSAS